MQFVTEDVTTFRVANRMGRNGRILCGFPMRFTSLRLGKLGLFALWPEQIVNFACIGMTTFLGGSFAAA
jgi:hypothetical protein